MIAAATPYLATSKMLFNWFDVALVLMLGFGFWRGRRNGMTKEVLLVSKWLVIIIAGAFGYKPLGDVFIRMKFIHSVFGMAVSEETVAYVSSYIIIALVVFIVFSFISRRLKPKLEGSNFFGSGEYYLGMVSGTLRYFCMLLFAMSLLNAPVYTQAEVIQAKNFNNRWFGGGVAGFSGDFFPTLNEMQTSVFKDSLTGPFLQSGLSILLISTYKYVPPSATSQSIYMGK